MKGLFKSLRFRLSIIFISLAVMPLLIATILLTRYSVAYLENQSQTILHEKALRVGNEIRAYIETHKTHLFLIYKLHSFELLKLEEQKTILNNLLFDQYIYQDIILLSAEGQELIRLSRSSVLLDKDLKNRATQKDFLFPATHKEPYFSAVYFDRKIREPLMTISIPLFDLRNKKLSFVLVANLRFKKIWDLLVNIEILGEGEIYVTNKAKQVVAHRNPSIVLAGTTINLPEVPGSAKGLSGADVIIAWDILQFGDQKMTIVAEQPVSQAYALITNTLKIAISISSVVFVLAIILTALAISRVVKPIEFLATSAKAIGKGDYSQHIEMTSQDEIGALASAFNQMSQDLVEYRNNMEELVQIRTEELAQTNRQLEQEIADRVVIEKEREKLIKELQVSLEKVKLLSGLLPICASCKKIRDDKGYWFEIESYIRDHSEANFSHGVCPECAKRLYPELYEPNAQNQKD
jgi:HAMP domain-containing protein